MCTRRQRFGRQRRNPWKINQKSIKNRCEVCSAKKASKNRTKIGFGRVWGSIWEGFGTLLGLLWALLGGSWPFCGRSKSYIFRAWVQDELQEAFWMDFGSLWEGFGTVLGGLGSNLEGFGAFWTSNGQILDMLGIIEPYCSKASKLDPRADPLCVKIFCSDLLQFCL